MIMLAAVVLPALLTPQVRNGQQLRYHTSWTRQMNEPNLAGTKPTPVERAYTVKVLSASGGQLSWTQHYNTGADPLLTFSSDASGDVVDRNNQKASGVPDFVYNAALLGQPPAILRPGATWTNAIHQPGSTGFWTSTVEEANAVSGLVRLGLSFQSHGEDGFRGDKSIQNQREDGEAVFVRGIMTKLSLRGQQSSILPQKRFTEAFTIETSLEDPGTAPAAGTLPALLVPHVHAGEQLLYRTVNSHRESLSVYTISGVSQDGSAQFTVTSDGVAVNGHPPGVWGFAYNAAQLGNPPRNLDVGTRWSNTVYATDGIDFWSVNVADIQPKQGLVRLHLSLVRRQVSMAASGYEEQAGDVTFVNGIMTSLSLSGFLNTTFDETAPYHNQDITTFAEAAPYHYQDIAHTALTNSYRIGHQTSLVSTVP